MSINIDRRKFIKTCCLASVVACGAYGIHRFRSYNGNHTGEDIYMVDVMTVSHCNLKCFHCNHFGSIADKWCYNTEQIKNDFKRLAEISESKIKIITLLGGEPLLHPDISKIIGYVREYFPNTVIDILTNGTLLDSMDEQFWQTAADTRAHIAPSFYDVPINWDSVYNKAQKYNALITRDEDLEGKMFSFEEIINRQNASKEKSFEKISLDPKGEQSILTSVKSCDLRAIVPTLKDGKLYPCYLPSVIGAFNKKFNQNLEVSDYDYIDIFKVDNLNSLTSALDRPILFCKYCKKTKEESPWGHSEVHTIEEWT